MASPKVTTVEIDLSQRVPAFIGMYGLMIGSFRKGPVGERMLITNRGQADEYLGRPLIGSDVAYHMLHAFLEKSQRCWVTRVAAADAAYGGVVVGSSFSALLGTGNGTTTQFTGTVPFSRCHPNTVSVYVDGDKVGYDNGSGVLQGTTLAALSTVVYETGIVTVNFSVAPPSGAKVRVRWGFPNVQFTAGKVTLDGYTFDERQLVQEIEATGLVYSDTLVPYPIVAPEDTVAAVGDATVVVYDGATPIVYFDESGSAVEIVADCLDDAGTNAVNYATGAVQFTLASGYTVAGTVTARYKSRLADLFVVYADSQGRWADEAQITVSKVQEDTKSFTLACYEVRSGRAAVLKIAYATSRFHQLDGFDRQQYLEDMVNGKNTMIRVLDNPYISEDDSDIVLDMAAFVPTETISHSEILGKVTPVVLSGGSDGAAVSVAAYIAALKTYNNKEDVPVDLVIDTLASSTYQTEIIKFCDRNYGGRGDCYGLLQIPFDVEQDADYTVEAINYRKYQLQTSSSFAGLYFGHVQWYDEYNGRTLWIPITGHIAGVFSYTADQFKPWFAAAGWKRGQLAVTDVYRKLSEGERDALYDADINALKVSPGRGIAVWGQKTLYGIPSALDRANVRWCLITLETAIEEYEEGQQFELNDAFTRKLIGSTVADYLEQVKAERGVYDYKVVCDETNNTAEVIDNNQMYVDFYLKPTRVAEFIFSRAVLMRTGATFDSVRLISG